MTSKPIARSNPTRKPTKTIAFTFYDFNELKGVFCCCSCGNEQEELDERVQLMIFRSFFYFLCYDK